MSRQVKSIFMLIAALGCLSLAGCSALPLAQPTLPQATSGVLPTQTPPSPSPTSTPAPTNTSTPVPTPDRRISSPLEGVEAGDLRLMIAKKYKTPLPYHDEVGHSGIDLFFFRYKSLTTIEGHPVQAVLAGSVAAVVQDRYPFGNAMIIETPLENWPVWLQSGVVLPAPTPTITFAGQPVCPGSDPSLVLDSPGRSLYILYAHLQDAPQFTRGDKIASGQVINRVGNTGNSGNPHLHLETRVGPSGARFDTISSYEGEKSLPQERYNYCIWALSQIFVSFDPTILWQTQP